MKKTNYDRGGAGGAGRGGRGGRNYRGGRGFSPPQNRAKGVATRSPAPVSPAGATNLQPARPGLPVQGEASIIRSPANPAGPPSQPWGPLSLPVQGQDAANSTGGLSWSQIVSRTGAAPAPVSPAEARNRFPANSTGGGNYSQIVTRTGAAPSPPPNTSPPAHLPLTEVQGGEEARIVPMKRPNGGGSSAGMKVQLHANYFSIKYDSRLSLFQYAVEIKAEKPAEGRFKERSLKISDLYLLYEKLFSEELQEHTGKTVFDGCSLYSFTDKLPTGEFHVNLLAGENTKPGTYRITIKLPKQYKYSEVNDYMNGDHEDNPPHGILQGLGSVMKDNPSKHGMCFGRRIFPFDFRGEVNLQRGVVAFRGFQQSLKPTSTDLSLVLDTCMWPFYKSVPVIDFLKEKFGFNRVNEINRNLIAVERELVGLKVTVTHRATKQRFKVMGLTEEVTRDLLFNCVDREGKVLSERVLVSDYFVNNYKKAIVYMDIPCLKLGTRKDAVPMEFCVICAGQRYPIEKLDDEAAMLLKEKRMVCPAERKASICQIVQSDSGPGGQVSENFGLEVDQSITEVTARVLDPPTVMLGKGTAILDQDKCQWNLLPQSLAKGVEIHRWALIDFTNGNLYWERFIKQLMDVCKSLGIHMEEPLAVTFPDKDPLSSVQKVRQCFEEVILKRKEGLQLIVCAMAKKGPGYNLLKLVSETQLGVLTQCLLSKRANKKDIYQFLLSLALKINAKVGGSNFEVEKLPGLEHEEHFMLIGADVNHPAPLDAISPSIAALVATINWPAANQYAARVLPQKTGKEQIVEFGSMCLELLNTYENRNNVKPKKIIIFRDGVSDSQFDMVLNEELRSLKTAIYKEDYKPEITLIVAQKRHHTRLFRQNDKQGVHPFNVPPGTVVDSKITHPFQFDFFLCSHFGGIGTSKSTHYHTLFDKQHFSSDQLQKLIYDLCFTFVRCAKPISVVPPVYYADLVAYRGRMYFDAIKKLQPRGFNSLDKNLFKVHANLKDSMFFV